jgi:dUTP pyrophosphatase
MQSTLKVAILSENAIQPTRAHASAGYDLYSTIDTVIEPKSRQLIPIDIAIELPPNTYAQIASRSGIAFELG